MRLTLAFLAVLLLAPLAPPEAAASHCTDRIEVIGRPAALQLPHPPYIPTLTNVCPERPFPSPLDGHTLPPGADQVSVRLNGDFGAGVRSLTLVLDGLGFAGHTFPLHRTPCTVDKFCYQLAEWLTIPERGASGTLTARVEAPGWTGTATVRTHPVQPPPMPST